MRAFVISLLFIAAPIYFAATFSGEGSGFAIGGFPSLSDVRQELASSDFARDALSQARDYAATHPNLVETIKAHRSELQELRSRVCAAVTC